MLTAAQDQDVTYEWHLTGGTVVSGMVHVRNGTPTKVTLPNVTITGKKLHEFTVTLKVTSPGGGSSTGGATCNALTP